MFNYQLEPGKKRNNHYDISKIKKMGAPLISIITAYYNAGEFFEQTFRCVVNQTFPWFEWIIVNDGSNSQGDIKVLNQLALTDERVRIINQSNGGAANARNNGIKNSKSEIIVFLDADDLIDCRYLEMTYWGLLCNKEVKWAYTDSVGFHGAEYIWEKEFSSEKMKEENILSYAAAIRKEVFSDNIYDDATRNNWEDWQLWLKMLSKGYRPFHIRKKMFWYRRCDGGMLSKIESNDGLREELLEKIKSLAASVPDGIRAVTPDPRLGLEFMDECPIEWDRVLPYKCKEKKISILLLLPHMECGGADKFNLDIIKNMNKEKYQLGIITTHEDPNEWEQSFAEELDDVFEMPVFLHKKDWMSFVYYYIKSRQVDIVFNINSYWAYYMLPLIRIDFPKIAIIDCVHAEGTYWRNGGYPRVSGKFTSMIERTFVTNDYTRNVLARKYGVPYDKMRLIYTGVDENIFCEEKIECKKERKLYRISDKRPTVLYLCRMCPEKRPFLMLDIAKKVNEKNPNVQFLVVGGGEYLEDLKMKVREMGLEESVIFTGRVEDTKAFYKMSDLFLLCSIKEGLSITTLEAMAMGLPLISADVGSQYEMIDDTTGKLIACRADEEKDLYNRNNDPQEVQDYADAICEWIRKLDKNREVIRNACKEKIKNGFTIRDMLRILEEEFEKLVSEEAMLEREIVSKELNVHRGVFEELLMLCNSFSSKELESNIIWEAKEFFYTQWMQERTAKMELESKLQWIYSLRTWKIVKRYHRFMEKTKIGHMLVWLRCKTIG